jgi:hypothetical protein
MTHVLIAADLLTVGVFFGLLIIVLLLIGAFSSGQVRYVKPSRRNSRQNFWDNNDANDSVFGQPGLLEYPRETTDHTFADTQNDLSIYQTQEHANAFSSDSSHSGSAGSVLGLSDHTESRIDHDSGGYGGLGSSAGEFLNLDNSSSGGSFGDSGGYSSDSSSSFSDNTSFSDNSSGGSFNNDN